MVAEYDCFMIEGAAVSVAGFLKMAHKFRGKNVAIVLCGRNIDFNKYMNTLKV